MSENTFQTIVKILRDDSFIKSKISKDINGNLSIRPADTLYSGIILPCITIFVEESEVQPVIPSILEIANIKVWTNPKETENDYIFRKQVIDAIVTLFNRKGDDFNEIDVVNNTGLRFCNFLKQSIDYDHDETIDKNYGEVIFEVIRSKDESFSVDDAGDKIWELEI